MSHAIIGLWEGMTLDLLTSKRSVSRIVRILSWGNCISNMWKFCVSSEVSNYCVNVGVANLFPFSAKIFVQIFEASITFQF